MFIVEDFITRPGNKADGQTALFYSELNARKFYKEQIDLRTRELDKIKSFNRDFCSLTNISISIEYTDGNNEVLCLREIEYFDKNVFSI